MVGEEQRNGSYYKRRVLLRLMSRNDVEKRRNENE